MKLVHGDQVENAKVTIQPSRLSHHDEPGRIKKLIELTVPADASNGGYAVSQLLGQDPHIGAKSVVTLEVSLTQQQISRLENITEEQLRDIRNGVNPAMIYGVRVYDSEPMDMEELINKGLSCGSEECRLDGVQEDPESPFVSIPCRGCGEPNPDAQWPKRYLLHRPDPDGCVYLLRNSPEVCWRMKVNEIGKAVKIREISWSTAMLDGLVAGGYLKEVDVNELWETLADRQRVIEQSVKPSGEYVGCVQWFQHHNPNVIVRRDSHDRCTYFEYDREPVSDMTWHENFSAWVMSGQWTEITQQEAELRINSNRKSAVSLADGCQPGICKREQFGGGGTPSPRNCDVCLEGPCPRVIPVQTSQADEPAMEALQKLAQEQGIDPAGMEAKEISDRLIAANLQGVSSEKPIPRNIPNLAFVGVDWGKVKSFTTTVVATAEPEQRVIELTMQSVLTPGVWVVAFDQKSHMLLEIKQERTLAVPVPSARISGPIGVKLPLQFRTPVMPKDYGRQVFFRDDEYELDGLKTGVLKGFSEDEKVYMVAVEGERTRYLKSRHIWTIDEPTEGF